MIISCFQVKRPPVIKLQNTDSLIATAIKNKEQGFEAQIVSGLEVHLVIVDCL